MMMQLITILKKDLFELCTMGPAQPGLPTQVPLCDVGRPVAYLWGPKGEGLWGAWGMVLASLCGDLGTHLQAGGTNLGIPPCVWSVDWLGKGVRRCVGMKTTQRVCCRQGTTSEGLWLTRPVYLQVSGGAETKQLGGWVLEDIYVSNRCTNPCRRPELG